MGCLCLCVQGVGQLKHFCYVMDFKESSHAVYFLECSKFQIYLTKKLSYIFQIIQNIPVNLNPCVLIKKKAAYIYLFTGIIFQYK